MDDNEAIHADFRRILVRERNSGDTLNELSQELFGDPSSVATSDLEYTVTGATQGEDGVEAVKSQVEMQAPFHVAFVDIRMPPGLNGVETTKLLWKVDPQLQVVLCTAYSDFRWGEVAAYLGNTDNLHVLRKPFSPSDVRRMADVLARRAMRLRPSKRPV